MQRSKSLQRDSHRDWECTKGAQAEKCFCWGFKTKIGLATNYYVVKRSTSRYLYSFQQKPKPYQSPLESVLKIGTSF